MDQRAFTVEEANAMLPSIETALDRLELLKTKMMSIDEKLQILDALWNGDAEEQNNPDHEEFNKLQHDRAQRIEEIQNLVREEIQAKGLRFPVGGLEQGLIDFPTTFEGRWVYLCWRRGEGKIAYWHDVDAGFQGRQEIAAEHVIRMGKEDDPDEMDNSALDL
tara:strand:- start:168 stop:656 length:489 start_codon:yes stop_codon:yes gene_type:complete